MTEIIAALISAVLGSLLTWLVTRPKSIHVECKELFRYRMSPSLAETEITFRKIQLKELYVIRISLKNTSSSVIDNPEINIKLEDGTQILGTSFSVLPERELLDNIVEQKVQDNKITFSINHIFPYTLNQEEVYFDIFGSTEINISSVSGSGILKDGAGWAVIFRQDQPVTTKLFFGFLNIGGAIAWIAALIYLTWKTYRLSVVNLNMINILQWRQDPLLWIIIALIGAWLTLGIFNLWTGGYFQVPIPFTDRRFTLRIVHRERVKL